MIMVVISEVLVHNLEVAPHCFLESALKIPPNKCLVFFHGHRTRSFVGNDGEILRFLPTYYRLHSDVQIKLILCPDSGIGRAGTTDPADAL